MVLSMKNPILKFPQSHYWVDYDNDKLAGVTVHSSSNALFCEVKGLTPPVL